MAGQQAVAQEMPHAAHLNIGLAIIPRVRLQDMSKNTRPAGDQNLSDSSEKVAICITQPARMRVEHRDRIAHHSCRFEKCLSTGYRRYLGAEGEGNRCLGQIETKDCARWLGYYGQGVSRCP